MSRISDAGFGYRSGVRSGITPWGFPPNLTPPNSEQLKRGADHGMARSFNATTGTPIGDPVMPIFLTRSGFISRSRA